MRTNRKTTHERHQNNACQCQGRHRLYTIDDLQFLNSEDFEKHIVAQDDDNDYSESGWVAVVKGRIAGLAKYSHCSCYGTWTSLTNDAQDHPSIVWDWIGSVNGLIKLATENRDPHMPARFASTEDYDYDHLQEVYREILQWNKEV